VQRGAQNNTSLEQTVDAQIPLMSEHLTNLQLMRLNLQAKATIPEAERLQLEQEQKELRLKELELDQRSFELFSQYPFRSGAHTHSKTRTPHYMVKASPKDGKSRPPSGICVSCGVKRTVYQCDRCKRYIDESCFKQFHEEKDRDAYPPSTKRRRN
jgi:hypothetical protein